MNTIEEDYVCAQKKYFRLKEGAEKELAKGLRKGYLDDTARIYKCEHCPGFHLTNGRKYTRMTWHDRYQRNKFKGDPVKLIAAGFVN